MYARPPNIVRNAFNKKRLQETQGLSRIRPVIFMPIALDTIDMGQRRREDIHYGYDIFK